MSRPDWYGDPVLAEEDRLDRLESRDPRPIRVRTFTLDAFEGDAIADLPDRVVEELADTSDVFRAERRRRGKAVRS